MNTHEILVAARNLIDRQGWVQKEFGHGNGGRCVWGACSRVGNTFSLEYQDAAGEFLRATGADWYTDSWGSVAAWNDAPGRTKDEVLAAFDRAIAATAPLPEDLDLDVPVAA